MTKTPWTPGPWVIAHPSDESDGSIYPAHINGGRRSLEVCQFIGDWRVSDVMLESAVDVRSKKANAHLIAAAPDLYEALEALLNDDGPEKLRSRHWDMARAALAKARGEAQ